jgi:hypothetical protein
MWKEAGVVVDRRGRPIFWHVPAERTTASLPDSRALWDVLWEHREDVSGFAHTHPGAGVPGPSLTDVTTFAAIEAGLGRRLDWWIASEDALVVVRWVGPDELSYQRFAIDEEPTWAEALREASRERR